MTLESELLAHSRAVLKRGAGIAKGVNPYLDEIRAIIKRRVLGFDEEKRTNERLLKLLRAVEVEAKKISREWIESAFGELKDFAKYEIDYQSETIGGYVNVEMVTPTVEHVWAAAKFDPLQLESTPLDLEGMFNDWREKEVARLVMGIKAGFVQGLTTKQIVKSVADAGGLIDISRRNAEAIALTSIAHITSAARNDFYKQNGDVVEGYKLLNTLDSRTSTICKAWKANKVYKYTDAYQPHPPFHFRCRTVEIVALSEAYDVFDIGGTRASKGADGGKQVDADLDYYQWLKQQPASFQDEALGRAKAMIFRNAGLSAEEFRKLTVDDLNRPYTLQQMAENDKRVAEYMRKVSEKG